MLSEALILLSLYWMFIIANGYILKNDFSKLGGNVIHCYCNLPSCITTSYMCRSDTNENGCFKKFDLVNLRYYYGCLESTIKQTLCPDIIEATAYSPAGDVDERFNKCCYSDMCNNESSEKLANSIQLTNIHINESDEEKINEILSLKYTNKISPPTNYYTNSEIWFRAILIAVPICGLMILFVLIFVAVRLLKSDVLDDGKSSSKLLNQKHKTLTNRKFSISVLGKNHNFRSICLPKCNIFPRNIMLMFKSHNKDQKSESTKYFFISKKKEKNNLNFNVPKVQEKYSRQDLNILKLPYKPNELKLKSHKNVNSTNNNCYNVINSVTVDSKLNYYKNDTQ